MRDAAQRLAALDGTLATVQTVRKEFIAHKEHLAQVERALVAAETDEQGRTVADGLDEIHGSAGRAQTRVASLQEALTRLGRLKGQLAACEADLAPLQAADGGIACIMGEVRSLRDRLNGALQRLESDGESTLAVHVGHFQQHKLDSEQRIAALKTTFAQLESMRADIGALFAGLNAALNGHAGPPK